MRVSVLVENSSNGDFQGEHGLSLFIEQGGKTYLLDVGQSDLFLENAHKLSISLEHVDAVICSHGHYDHGNGFSSFFMQNEENVVYASASVFKEYYSNSKGVLHYIGFDYSLQKYQDRFCFVKKNQKIEDAFLILDPPHPEVGKKRGLFAYNGEQYVSDDFSHELSLVFETECGLIVFNSCSHIGMQAIVMNVEEQLHKKVYAYIGGLHLKSPQIQEEELKELSDFINEHIALVYTGHCTGDRAFDYLYNQCENRIHSLQTGCIYEIK